MAKRGRPAMELTPDLMDEICESIIAGDSLRRLTSRDDMPALATVTKWLRENPDFAAQYARAKSEQADTFADQILDIVQQVVAGTLDPQAGRVAIDALKWTASKLKPKRYGDRIDVNQNVQVSLSDMIMGIETGRLLEGETVPTESLEHKPN